MTYLGFLGQWFNLAFLALALAGLFSMIWGRAKGRDLFAVTAGLILTAFIGLTMNGAIHDLGLGSPAPRFPLVLIVSVAVGWLGGWGLGRVRERHFRPISAVRFNRPGHEGVEATLVTREAGPVPGSGRAQWQDSEGALHIVHVHTAAEEIGFGRRVVLGTFDPSTRSYRVTALPRRRRDRRSRDEEGGV